MAKIERSQKLFLKALKEKFAEDPQSEKTVFAREGLKQSARKKEFIESGKKMEMARGISMYDPVRCHLGGIPLGQRQLMTYEVSGTPIQAQTTAPEWFDRSWQRRRLVTVEVVECCLY